jgi:hypothetical protein
MLGQGSSSQLSPFGLLSLGWQQERVLHSGLSSRGARPPEVASSRPDQSSMASSRRHLRRATQRALTPRQEAARRQQPTQLQALPGESTSCSTMRGVNDGLSGVLFTPARCAQQICVTTCEIADLTDASPFDLRLQGIERSTIARDGGESREPPSGRRMLLVMQPLEPLHWPVVARHPPLRSALIPGRDPRP